MHSYVMVCFVVRLATICCSTSYASICGEINKASPSHHVFNVKVVGNIQKRCNARQRCDDFVSLKASDLANDQLRIAVN